MVRNGHEVCSQGLGRGWRQRHYIYFSATLERLLGATCRR
jgi:hypothetical protein